LIFIFFIFREYLEYALSPASGSNG